MKRRVLGTMTGTSCDGLDISLLEIEGKGLNLKATFIEGSHHDLGELGKRLRNLSEGQSMTMEDLCQLNHDFTSFHIRCIEKSHSTPLDLIVPHGQTLFHAPPLSLQLIDLSQLGAKLMVPVIGDLRGADLARGGQGAPITPLADQFLYGNSKERKVIANFGGFCNLTLLSGDGVIENIRGFDVCVTNLLLDLLARNILEKPFDKDGLGAREGEEIPSLRKKLEQKLRSQFQKNSSLGQHDLPDESWFHGLEPNRDLLKTSCLAIGKIIGEAVSSLNPERLLVAGGGALNPVLMDAVSQSCGLSPESCDNYGPSSEYRESSAMAILGALAQDRVPTTLQSVTKAEDTFISGLYLDPRPT